MSIVNAVQTSSGRLFYRTKECCTIVLTIENVCSIIVAAKKDMGMKGAVAMATDKLIECMTDDKEVAGERDYITEIKEELQDITDIDKAKRIYEYVTALASLT